MGYHRHHAIIVTCWKSSHIEDAHARALELFEGTPAPVTPIADGAINAFRSFAVLPDGSKEGWGDSDRADEARAEFKRWLRAGTTYCDWAEVDFGGDDADVFRADTVYGSVQAVLDSDHPSASVEVLDG
jgi:hypothetical protein